MNRPRHSRIKRTSLKLAVLTALVGGALAAPAHAGPPFDPSIVVQTGSTVAGTPTSLSVTVVLPQDGLEDPDGLATSHLKRAQVSLPPEMTLAAGAGNNIASCSSQQIGLHVNGVPNCPEASKLGTVVVTTPLLDESLTGFVYLAKPFDNPFNNLITIYLVVGPGDRGVIIKLAGKVTLNPTTGQIVTNFDNNPQLPFDHLTVNLNRPTPGALTTPPCGSHSVGATFWSWSQPNVPNPRSDGFDVTGDADGTACTAGDSAPGVAGSGGAPSFFSAPLGAASVFAKAKRAKKHRAARRAAKHRRHHR